jgi:hypothetical protein
MSLAVTKPTRSGLPKLGADLSALWASRLRCGSPAAQGTGYRSCPGAGASLWMGWSLSNSR